MNQVKKVSFEDMMLVDPLYPKVRVDLEWIGEGISGDFNANDPKDEPLLRFTVYRKDKEEPTGWTQVDDASYCTNLPATAPRKILAQALMRIFDKVAGEVEQDHSVKKLCEELSHISLDWIKEEVPAETFNRKVVESVADIALTAGVLFMKGDFQIEDSREFVGQIIEWSKEFNTLHQLDEWENVSYIEAIDAFAKTKILDQYGSDIEERTAIEVVVSDETKDEDNPGWDVDVYERGGDRKEDLTRSGLQSLLFVNSYIDALREKFDVIILNQQHVPLFFIKDCWAVEDANCGYGNTYESLEDALTENKEEKLLKGFCIKDEEDNLAETFTFWESRGAALFEISDNLKGIVG
ncbi:hypothetical protein [Paenibacillus taichungensis]